MNRITLDGWKLFSERNASTSYVSEDSSRLLKTVNNTDPNTLRQQQSEYETAQRMSEMGIPVPTAYDMVEVEGKGTGIIFQNINNKLSISRALSKDPEDPEKYIDIFVRLTKIIHTTKITDGSFPSYAQTLKDAISRSTDIYTEEEKAKLIAAIEKIPETYTGLHGDFHMGNIITGDEGDFIIDVGDFSYGNPIFDWAQFYLMTHLIADPYIERVFHMPKEKACAVFKECLMKSYDLHTDEEYDAKVAEIEPLSMISPARFLGIMKGPDEDLRMMKPHCSYLK